MIVYRFQAADGRGPYWNCAEIGSAKLNCMLGRHNCDPQNHPSPWNDAQLSGLELSDIRLVRFGFANIAQALAWFSPEEIKEMLACNIQCYAIDCPRKSITFLGYQVAFLKEDVRSEKPFDILAAMREAGIPTSNPEDENHDGII